MQKTDNYELNLPEAEEFFSIEDFNDNTKKIDEVLESLENPEHDTGKQIEVEELASGESLKIALRKLAKAVADYISHKADKVAHITAEERTAWNAKLGVEKIAANLTTDTDGMVLAAAMGKNLQEQISTLNSNMNSSSMLISVTGVGWYRIAKYTNNNVNNVLGAADNSVDVVIKRRWSNENNEHHEFKLLSIYGSQEFVDVCNKSNVHRFTKARYTYDSNHAYIEVYYSGYTINDCMITLTNRLSCNKTAWEAICEKTSETVDGVTITATYDLPKYSILVTSKDE